MDPKTENITQLRNTNARQRIYLYLYTSGDFHEIKKVLKSFILDQLLKFERVCSRGEVPGFGGLNLEGAFLKIQTPPYITAEPFA